MIKNLQSIQKVSEKFATKGSEPVLVIGNDLETYVCKYILHRLPASRLFNEYIASSFLKIWQIPTPEIAFMEIKKEHVLDLQKPFKLFEPTCFASKYIRHAKDLENLTLLNRELINDNIKKTAIKIAFFDIWLANEDRNNNNYNLLIDSSTSAPNICAIDHECCFNTDNLYQAPYAINEATAKR